MDDDGYDYIGTPADHDPAGPPAVGIAIIAVAVIGLIAGAVAYLRHAGMLQ